MFILLYTSISFAIITGFTLAFCHLLNSLLLGVGVDIFSSFFPLQTWHENPERIYYNSAWAVSWGFFIHRKRNEMKGGILIKAMCGVSERREFYGRGQILETKKSERVAFVEGSELRRAKIELYSL